MTHSEFFKSLLALGFHESSIDNGLWSYDGKVNDNGFAIYYSVILKNGEIKNAINMYYNGPNNKYKNERWDLTDKFEDAIEIMKNFVPTSNHFYEYKVTLNLTSDQELNSENILRAYNLNAVAKDIVVEQIN